MSETWKHIYDFDHSMGFLLFASSQSNWARNRNVLEPNEVCRRWKPLITNRSVLQSYNLLYIFNRCFEYKVLTSGQKPLHPFSEGDSHVQWVHTHKMNNTSPSTQSCFFVQYFKRSKFSLFSTLTVPCSFHYPCPCKCIHHALKIGALYAESR